MKKLLVFAAVAAMSAGVYAGLCDDDPEVIGCSVYNVKISLKTLGPKTLKCKDECIDDSCVAYYENTSRKIDGIFWSCDHDCFELVDGMNFVAWEKKTKTAVTEELKWNPATSNTPGYWSADECVFAFVDRYSKKANKVQAGTQFELKMNGGDAWLIAGGFGTYDAKNDIVKSISGYCVGALPPVEDIECHCEEVSAGVFSICDEFTSWCEDPGYVPDELVAYGTWSVKYSKSLSSGKKKLSQIVPSYARD